jgi:hypothetical protein
MSTYKWDDMYNQLRDSTLVNTAHNGGRLVHEFGVHSVLAPTHEATNSAKPEAATTEQSETER